MLLDKSLSTLWSASRTTSNFTRRQLSGEDIEQDAENVLTTKVSFSFSMKSTLMLGIVRVYSLKAKWLYTDCVHLSTKIRASDANKLLSRSDRTHMNLRECSSLKLPEKWRDFDMGLMETDDGDDLDLSAAFERESSRRETNLDPITLRNEEEHSVFHGFNGFNMADLTECMSLLRDGDDSALESSLTLTLTPSHFGARSDGNITDPDFGFLEEDFDSITCEVSTRNDSDSLPVQSPRKARILRVTSPGLNVALIRDIHAPASKFKKAPARSAAKAKYNSHKSTPSTKRLAGSSWFRKDVIKVLPIPNDKTPIRVLKKKPWPPTFLKGSSDHFARSARTILSDKLKTAFEVTLLNLPAECDEDEGHLFFPGSEDSIGADRLDVVLPAFQTSSAVIPGDEIWPEVAGVSASLKRKATVETRSMAAKRVRQEENSEEVMPQSDQSLDKIPAEDPFNLDLALASESEDSSVLAGDKPGGFTLSLAKCLKEQTNLPFSELTTNLTRKSAAKSFFSLLVLEKWNAVCVRQDHYFGNMVIAARPGINSLLDRPVAD